MTSFVDSHDWHFVLVCLIEKMDHSLFECILHDTFWLQVNARLILPPVPLR